MWAGPAEGDSGPNTNSVKWPLCPHRACPHHPGHTQLRVTGAQAPRHHPAVLTQVRVSCHFSCHGGTRRFRQSHPGAGRDCADPRRSWPNTRQPRASTTTPGTGPPGHGCAAAGPSPQISILSHSHGCRPGPAPLRGDRRWHQSPGATEASGAPGGTPASGGGAWRRGRQHRR